MIDFIVGVVSVCMAIAIAVWVCVFAVIALRVAENWSKRSALKSALPPPDRAAERMYGQQYFERAIGRKK